MAFRNALRLRPVNSVKHEITWSDLASDYSAGVIKVLAVGVTPSAANLSTEVPIGTTISSIFFEFNIAAQTTTNPKVLHWKLAKLPFGTTASAATLYNQVDRRFIIHRGMEMLPSDVATVFKRVFVSRIPPRLRRLGDGDQLVLMFRASSAETINNCGFAIYKAFS